MSDSRTTGTRKSRVYVVEGGAVVKIGRSTNIWSRLRALQIGSPLVLRIAAHFEGGCGTEHWLHGRFEEHHSHGEWFHLRGPVATWFDRVTDLMQRGQLTRDSALRAAGAKIASETLRAVPSAWEPETPRPSGIVMLEARRLSKKL